jgi:hypothetical protein
MEIRTDATATTNAIATERVRIASREVLVNEVNVALKWRERTADKGPIADAIVLTPAGTFTIPLFADNASTFSTSHKLTFNKAWVAQNLETYVFEKLEAILAEYQNNPAMQVAVVGEKALAFYLFAGGGITKGTVAVKTNYGAIFNCKFGVYSDGTVFVKNPVRWVKEYTSARTGKVTPAHEEDGGFAMNPTLRSYLIDQCTQFMIEKRLIGTIAPQTTAVGQVPVMAGADAGFEL